MFYIKQIKNSCSLTWSGQPPIYNIYIIYISLLEVYEVAKVCLLIVKLEVYQNMKIGTLISISLRVEDNDIQIYINRVPGREKEGERRFHIIIYAIVSEETIMDQLKGTLYAIKNLSNIEHINNTTIAQVTFKQMPQIKKMRSRKLK